MASLNSSIGVMFAGDFLTLFIFFEGLIIFPYALVAHKEDGPSLRGANFYLYLGAASSLSLLFGIGLLYHFTGSIMIQPLATAVNTALAPSVKYWIALFMIVGFGGKAGLFLEHIWLPNAHPVAPTPASCLLSGAMIKAGAYGIFRVTCMLFVPPHWDMTRYVSQWATMSNIGYAIIWVGITTMFLGVLSALISANSKRMLAFHSVSQMGYIVMGIGCGAYMGSDGAMGLAGGIYHIINHALFKASLFICVGAFYYQTHELDMYKLGGMLKRMPVVAIGLLIAACGIAGIPGFNGFASKTLLHHAILEAYEHSAHLGNGVPDFKLRFAEIIFMITAGGTFASNMKLFVLTSLGETPKKYAEGHHAVGPASTAFRVTIIMVSCAILFVGLNPNWMLENFIGPALQYFNFNPSSHAHHLVFNTHAAVGEAKSIIPILYPITGITDAAMSTWSDVIHNLNGGGIAVLLGGMYFIIGMSYHWFHFEVPEKCEFAYYYQKVVEGFKWFCVNPVSAFGVTIDRILMSPRSIMVDGFRGACINIFSPFGDLVDKFVMTPVWGFMKGFKNVCVNPVSSFGDHVDRFLMTPVWSFVRGFIKLCASPVSALGDVVDRVMMKPVWPTINSLEKFMKHPLSSFGDFVDRAIMRPMVLFWLPLSNQESFIEWFEKRFVPRFVYEKEIWQKKIARLYLMNAEVFKIADSQGIDPVVNAVADGALCLGEKALKTETHRAHIFAASIVIGMVIMMTLILFFGFN
jgi:formate hydrogenlyase subunit 3/multisubunit Na+/H+ antiporter MnhD subunit